MLIKFFGGLLPQRKKPAKRENDSAASLDKAAELMANGDMHAAIALFKEYLESNPYNVEIINNLGVCLNDVGNDDEARAAFELVYSLDDTFTAGLVNYARMLIDKRHSTEALPYLQQVKIGDPGFSHVDAVYAGLCLGGGDVAKARHFQRRAWLSNFDKMRYANCYLFYSAYDDLDEATLASEHQFWAETVRSVEWGKSAVIDDSEEVEKLPRDGSGRIRIGYWSPDFRNHSVRYFFRPLLEGHDYSKFEIFLYHDGPGADAQTELIKNKGDHFFDVFGLSDFDLYKLIKSHDLDILIELAGHSSHNRITLLQKSFASVQMTALGYPPTTGLHTMDAKVLDPYVAGADPSRYYSEFPLALPSSFWCFDPKDEIPITPAPPVDANGFITFGCAGNIAKINARMLQCWREILCRVPDSRLLIRSISFEDPAHEEAMRHRLVMADMDMNRVDLRRPEGGNAFFNSYREIDIVLDTFPFNGGTTTCFATYMGVPVVNLVGTSLMGRMGLSILSNLGVPELAVQSESEYIDRAVTLASDRDFLRAFRTDARARFHRSSLGNGKIFASEFEKACAWFLNEKKSSNFTYTTNIAPLPESEVIRRAYTVLRYGHIEAALRIVNYCFKYYPDSGSAHLFVAQRLAAEKRSEEAESYVMARLASFKPAEQIAALISMVRLYLLRKDKTQALKAVDQLLLLAPQDAFDRLQVEWYRASCMAPVWDEAKPPVQAFLASAPPQHVHVLIPCDDVAHFNAMRAQITAACLCPQGWQITYERCTENERAIKYRSLAKSEGIDVLAIVQNLVEIHNPMFFVELANALENHDVLGFSGASRWQRIDWRLDDFDCKAAGFMIASPEQADFFEIQWLGQSVDAVVGGMAVLDGNLLALRPGSLGAAIFDDELLGVDCMLEEDWTHMAFHAGLRLSVHRNLGILVHPLRNQNDDARVRGPVLERCVDKHGFDPFAVMVDDPMMLSVPAESIGSAMAVVNTFLKLQAAQ